MRRYLGPLAIALSAVAAPTEAQDSSSDKKTVINLNYDSVMDRARPNPMSDGKAHFHIQVTLWGKNKITQVQDLSSGRLSEQRTTDQDLGEDARSGVWHVASRNRLVHVWNMAQSVRTIAVTLKPDNTCDLNVKDVLKPGFHEYAFQARWTAGLEYYSRYENTNTSCEIR
jgi:hypothetical protein